MKTTMKRNESMNRAIIISFVRKISNYCPIKKKLYAEEEKQGHRYLSVVFDHSLNCTLHCMCCEFVVVSLFLFQSLCPQFCLILGQSAIHSFFPAVAHCIGQRLFHMQHFMWIWSGVSIYFSYRFHIAELHVKKCLHPI